MNCTAVVGIDYLYGDMSGDLRKGLTPLGASKGDKSNRDVRPYQPCCVNT